jgi:hypothetical protein
MKLIRLLLTAVIITAGISSCQKEITEDATAPIPPNIIPDSNYLSKMYEIGIERGITDTVEIWTYTYDANKRVILLSDSSDVIGASYVANWQYFYNGNDTIPYKSIYTVLGPGYNSADSLISYFYYNASGQRIKDSVIDQNGTANDYRKNFYQYLPGKIYGISKDSTYNGFAYVVYLTFDSATVVNGNILYNKKYFYSSADSVISTFTYDDKPAPFERLSNFKTFEMFPFGETFFYEMPQNNNRLKANEFSSGTGYLFEEDFTGKYIYKSNGYPSQIYYPDPADPALIYKISFVYKAL